METEKIVLLQVKGLLQTIVKFRAEKIFLQVSVFHQTSFRSWEARYIVHDIYYHVAAILYTGTNWKFMFSWRKVNWHELQIAKAYFVFPIGSWIVKKVLRGRRFFTVVMLHVPKISANKPYKKIVPRIFQFFQPLKTGFMSACNFYRYEHV